MHTCKHAHVKILQIESNPQKPRKIMLLEICCCRVYILSLVRRLYPKKLRMQTLPEEAKERKRYIYIYIKPGNKANIYCC